jgi:hypothetical protein
VLGTAWMRGCRPGSVGTRRHTLMGGRSMVPFESCGAQSDIDMNRQIHDGPQVYTKECHLHMNVRKASTARDHAGPAGHLTSRRLVTTGSARESGGSIDLLNWICSNVKNEAWCRALAVVVILGTAWMRGCRPGSAGTRCRTLVGGLRHQSPSCGAQSDNDMNRQIQQ